jgi:hypothetical protein
VLKIDFGVLVTHSYGSQKRGAVRLTTFKYSQGDEDYDERVGRCGRDMDS